MNLQSLLAELVDRVHPVDVGVSRLLLAMRRTVGAPDYAAYLVHHERHHRGTRAMSQAEFFRSQQNRHYGSARSSKCC